MTIKLLKSLVIVVVRSYIALPRLVRRPRFMCHDHSVFLLPLFYQNLEYLSFKEKSALCLKCFFMMRCTLSRFRLSSEVDPLSGLSPFTRMQRLHMQIIVSWLYIDGIRRFNFWFDIFATNGRFYSLWFQIYWSQKRCEIRFTFSHLVI